MAHFFDDDKSKIDADQFINEKTIIRYEPDVWIGGGDRIAIADTMSRAIAKYQADGETEDRWYSMVAHGKSYNILLTIRVALSGGNYYANAYGTSLDGNSYGGSISPTETRVFKNGTQITS